MVVAIVHMDSKRKFTVSWSGGKDAMLALHRFLKNESDAIVVHLHCVLRMPQREVGLHGIKEELIDAQAAAMNLPLVKYYLDEGSNASYETLVKRMYEDFAKDGITGIIFGDIFLEDLKAYRTKLLEGSGLTATFPLWKEESLSCVESLINEGFRCVVCAANAHVYHAGLLGRTIDTGFLDRLPDGVDPAGENGEYHTFVIDGPLFGKPVGYTSGAVTQREFALSAKQDQESNPVFYFQELVLK